MTDSSDLCCINDAQTGMPPGIPRGAMCVQRFDDSRNSAIHITYRISLRSSSMREPRDPLLKVEKGQSISRLPFWVGIKFYCVLFYLTLIVLTLYLNGIFHHHYSIIVLIADCTALYLPSFECAAKQVIKYAFPSFSYRTTML